MVRGRAESVPGFHPSIDAEIVSIGNNFIQADADGKRCRPDARAVMK